MTGKCVKVLAFNHSFSFLALIRSLRLQAAKSRIDDGIPRSRKARDKGAHGARSDSILEVLAVFNSTSRPSRVNCLYLTFDDNR